MKLFYTAVARWPQGAEEIASRLVSAARLTRAKKQKSAEAARGILAAGLLVRYALGCMDGDLRQDAHGKPYLPEGSQFNLTHGGAIAAIGVADEPCGVDAEPLCRQILHPQRLFCEQELASGMPPAVLWARKEALWKADGRGVALAKRPVSVLQDEAALDGVLYQVRTFVREGHAISAAVRGEEILQPVCLAFSDLL